MGEKGAGAARIQLSTHRKVAGHRFSSFQPSGAVTEDLVGEGVIC